MNEIKAGVVVVTKFCQSGSREFASYVDYIGRDEAIRAEYSSKYNLYHDYMGNPEKSTGLFTEQGDIKTDRQKKQLKDIFQTAQDKGSLMWQTVISFDDRWLEYNGLFNSRDSILDESRIKNITRASVRKMLEKEGLEDAVWSAAIHYNTDNIHIHIATVEPEPVREKKLYAQYDTREENGETVKTPVLDGNGQTVMKMEYKGTFRQGSIEACKRELVNRIINERENNLKINSIIRDSIVKQKRAHPLSEDRELAQGFLNLYQHMPDCSRNMWNYNNPVMHPLKPEIDSLSEVYLTKYHGDEYRELKERLLIQEQKYRTAYGRTERSYTETKIGDLYTRLGNAILKEIRQFDREEQEADILNMDQTVISGPEEKELEGDDQGVIYDPPDGIHPHDSLVWDTEGDIPDTDQTEIPEAERVKKPGHKQGVTNDPLKERPGRVMGYRTEWSKDYKEARNLIHRRPPDYSRAVQILEKEHSGGNILATYELGDVYRYGRGTPIDAARADSYYSRAREGFQYLYETTSGEPGKWKHQYMAYRLGKMYYYGLGTGTDYEKALNLFQESGSDYARYMIGKMDYEKKKYTDAAKHFSKCDDMYSHHYLGKIYLEKEGKMYDPEKGIGYLKQSAQEGNSYAELNLGWLFLKGEAVPRDRKEAENWFRQAADHGNEQAEKILDELEKGKHCYARQHIRKGTSVQKAVSRMKKGMKSEWEKARLEREHARMVEQSIRE